ncbi:F-box/kelch-repeat protein At3g23880-like [Coffea arabica]|uniref:F-box/kelch-repeat protein At3g23880-like n=1 Tax=Coffea arabica TaxID=13443 RepID=A0A6P6WYV9_COFAR|nr:F-box/kelch-repeat protein At3g23880-like [Coffea arabica]
MDRHAEQPKRGKNTHKIQCPSSSTSNPESEAEEISISCHVPDEIITEILLRLPVEALLRFRCLSKSWLSLISNRKFIRSHLVISSNNDVFEHHRVIFAGPDESSLCPRSPLKQCSIHPELPKFLSEATDFYPSLELNDTSCPEILGSCEGLVFVSCSSYYLWNPSIKKSKRLPDLVPRECNFCLSKYVCGYDASIDDYKVFKISIEGTEAHDTIIEVYSLNTNSWRTIEGFKGDPYENSFCFVSSKLHWTTCPTFSSVAKIRCLDLTNDTYGEVEQPEFGDGNCFYWSLHALGGCFGLCCYHQGYYLGLDIWIMKEYSVKESWIKVVSVPLDDPRYGMK